MEKPLKSRTVKALKWNVIDRISTQLLYAVTGIVLARELSQEAFGMVGALLVFQSFAMLMVDSGFSWALIQKKQPDNTDYSSVFWFNLIMACAIYGILWLCAPMIARLFGDNAELIPLGRLMFLTFIINALSIVQTNRLMKQMNVRPIAVANMISLIIGGIVGIWLACIGYGAWAIVWQSISLNAVKALCLWIYCRWIPARKLSISSLRSFFRIGVGMMGTSFLNVVFQNIYSFFIGNRSGLVPLGYYTQADKWSKMGITSITQIITSTFLPTLSEIQDDRARYQRIVRRIDSSTALLLYPSVACLVVMAPGIFHLLFGSKWNPSIILFQLLLVRGVFTILNTLYNNFMLALGNSKSIFRLELLRDTIALIALILTLPQLDISNGNAMIHGLVILLVGQLIASAVTWCVSLVITSRVTGIKIVSYLKDSYPGLILACLLASALWLIQLFLGDNVATLAVQSFVATTVMLPIVWIKLRKHSNDSQKLSESDSDTTGEITGN